MKTIKLAMAACLVFGLTACEWDNSDKYEKKNQPSPPETETPDPIPSNPEDKDPTTRLISGKGLLEGYLTDAKVCADLNNDGICNADEPATRTDQTGEFQLEVGITEPQVSLILEAESGVTTDAATGSPVSPGFIIRSQEDTDREFQVISPLTELVLAEMERDKTLTLEQAKNIVKGKLEISVDPFTDYVDLKENGPSLDKANAERLQRISTSINLVTGEIASGIDDSALAGAGMDDDDKRQIVNDQLDIFIQDLVDDVNESLESDIFDPWEIMNNGKYETPEIKLEPKSLDAMNFAERAANAEPVSPFFYQDGFERKALVGTETYKILIRPHPDEYNKVYYEALRRLTNRADVDAAETVSHEILPARNEHGFIQAHNLSLEAFNCFYFIRCHRISIGPESFSALMWTGSAFRGVSIKRGNRGDLVLGEGSQLGDVIALAYQGSLPTVQNYKEVDLSGLAVKAVLQEIYKGSLPLNMLVNLDEAAAAITFPQDAKAYVYNETTIGNMIFSSWPGGKHLVVQGSSVEACALPGTPLVSEVNSCNLAYGQTPAGVPARTLSELMYPTGAIGSTNLGQFISLAGPGESTYAMRLFGSASSNEGAIQIDRLATDGTWSIVTSDAKWTKKASPFPHVQLELPDGYRYNEAREGFETGTAILFERSGYVRHGWTVPEGLDAELLFGRKPTRFLFNNTAFNSVHNTLLGWNVLETHPYYWENGRDTMLPPINLP